MKKQYFAIDIAKYVSSLLVICIHTFPFQEIAPDLNLVIVQILARIAVPFYCCCSSYFLFKKIRSSDTKQEELGIMKRYSFRILKLYLIWTILYLPIIYINALNSDNLFNSVYFIKNLFLNGSVYHLWFLPALLMGTWIVYLIFKKVRMPVTMLITFLLYVIGMLSNMYSPVLEQVPFLHSINLVIIQIFDTTRNGIFFVSIYIVIGAILAYTPRFRTSFIRVGLVISSVLLCAEVYTLQYQHLLTDLSSMYLSLIPLTFFLFAFLLQTKSQLSDTRVLRSMSTLIYCGHVWIIAALTHVVQANLIVSMGTILLSTILSFLIVKGSYRVSILENLY
ncbi:acyltransferase family protein [Breznakia pachnodae]|uniref:Serine/alanine racemase n=1 Tax=Breznakia pachnodae TaxID=265178 RepID=A0ABU0E4X7_9FIRM|nr:acyltransferase [Breznakia pachnodae]MDQ0361776.1 serine/alanine racemase [Breznakia pachnodae]